MDMTPSHLLRAGRVERRRGRGEGRGEGGKKKRSERGRGFRIFKNT